jgi:hypothetical protein
MSGDLEGRDDTEAATAAADGPEQVSVLLGADVKKVSIGGDDRLGQGFACRTRDAGGPDGHVGSNPVMGPGSTAWT